MTETSFVLNKNMRNFGDAHEKLNFVDSNWQVRLYLFSINTEPYIGPSEQ